MLFPYSSPAESYPSNVSRKKFSASSCILSAKPDLLISKMQHSLRGRSTRPSFSLLTSGYMLLQEATKRC